MIKVNDKIFRWLIILIPFVLDIVSESLSEKPFDTSWSSRAVLSLSTIIIICEGNRFIIYKTRSFFFGRHQASTRLLMIITAGLVFTTGVMAVNLMLRNYIIHGDWNVTALRNFSVTVNNEKIHIGLTTVALVKALFIFFPLLFINEAIYHFAKLRHTEKAKEQLEKEKLRAELQQLKGVMNPHFLFNNLNSLSSLISEDPQQAEAFLDEFTKVFRYVLRNNENELTTLKQEIEFIGSYYHLLQTRYGSAIKLLFRVDKEYEDLMVPPLTLQLLIENAVKHNRTQKEMPLQIELSAMPGNMLLVRNNIIKKDGKVESTGIGLQSINARYRIMNLPGVTIKNDDAHFSVMIPLVNG